MSWLRRDTVESQLLSRPAGPGHAWAGPRGAFRAFASARRGEIDAQILRRARGWSGVLLYTAVDSHKESECSYTAVLGRTGYSCTAVAG